MGIFPAHVGEEVRVLMVGDYPPSPGGTANHLFNIAGNLKRLHDITLLVPGKGNSNENDLNIIRLRTFGSIYIWSFIFVIKAFFRMMLSLKKYDICHIHIHGFFMLFLLIPPSLFAKKSIITIHSYNGRLYRRNKILKYISSLLIKLASRVIAVSKSDREEISVEMNRDIKYIHNGVDTEVFTLKGETSDRSILYFGRLDKDKSVDLLIRSFSDIKDNNTTLVICGSGPEDKYLKKLAGDLGLGKHILFSPHITGNELVSLINKSLFTINPSPFESMPLSILESISCGKAVIVADIPPMKEFIEQKLVLPFQADDQKDLTSKIERLIKNKKILKEIKQKCLLVREKYSWKDTCKTLNEVYLDL